MPSRRPACGLLLLLAWLTVVAAAVRLAAGAQLPPTSPRPPPTVFLHLSDIHYSTNVRKYWKLFGDREGDAQLLTRQLVPRLALSVVVITGDITDSKTARGDGLQQEAEWLSYASLLRDLNAAGMPDASILDVPGNHDTFNMPVRGGPNDFFSKYAAEGRRRASPAQRIYLHKLPAQQGTAGTGTGTGEGTAAEGQRCPAAWMLGIDPTPEPGLRSPTNFAGLATPALLEEARSALESIPEQHPSGCGPPIILVYCHYPLSTIDSAVQTLAGPPGVLRHVLHSASPMQGLTQLLAEHNVTAVLSGHLHSSFGQRLHRVHTTPSGGHMAEIETAAWKDDRRFRLVALDGGTLSFADLMFHTRNSPRMPGRSDAAAMQEKAWQDAYAQRGWAVTALEPTATVIGHIALITSPPDGRYSALGGPVPARPPQGQPQSAGAGAGEGVVRALVFALEGVGSGSEGLRVQLTGYLPGGTRLFTRRMELVERANSSTGSSSSSDSSGSGDGPLLFEAQGDTTVFCVAGAGVAGAAGVGDAVEHCQPPAEHALIQVSVEAADGSISRSHQQPVALRCATLTNSSQKCWVAAVEGRPLPLKASLLEWLGLGFHWPVMVHRLFLCALCFQIGAMLLLPRTLASRVLPLIAASPLLQCRPEQQLPATPQAAATSGSLGTAAAQAARAGLGYLLWPVAALFLCASVTEVWACLLAYSTYLLAGPWLVYTALSGYPPALMFHYGVMGRLSPSTSSISSRQEQQGAGWLFKGTPDTMFVSLVHTVLCLLPVTLWVACVVGRRLQMQRYQPLSRSSSRSNSEGSSSSSSGGRRMEAGGPGASSTTLHSALRHASSAAGTATAPAACDRWSFSAPQLVALLLLTALNWAAIYHKAISLMGWTSLLLSPGMGWTLPLALLLVCAWGGPQRPCQQPAKGE